ncbi:MAG TPA: hypothetical protein VE398_07755 [Acidobacteriota bacterium]|nr:hypothetical protein [Acidobacteriota bacterium]
MQTKQRFDPKSPEIQALRREIRLGTFTREGMMVAFPMCLPGVTVPIVHDESRITALDITPDGVIYGGTSGKQAHLFAANFRGLTGIVFDIGAPAGANRCAGMCFGSTRFVAFVNGPRGGRAVSARAVSLFQDLIQEWSFTRPPLDDLGECVAGEPVAHAVTDMSRRTAVGVTSGHLFTVDLEGLKIQVVGEVPAASRIALGSKGGVYGCDGERYLWRFDPKTREMQRNAVPLPAGVWNHSMSWARDGRNGLLYTAEGGGRLFSFDEERGFSGPLGRAPLAPVGPMAATLDGRVFGFCGPEIAKMFCFEPRSGEVTNLGVAVSVLERRRYGYVFGDAVTGREGEIIFGEDDDGGHLWLYFPRIRA